MEFTIYKNNHIEIDYEELLKKIYKLLPIYEGKKKKNSEEKIDGNIAYDNFDKNLSLICMQLKGLKNEIEFSNKMVDILMTLEGLKDIGCNQHKEVRCAILHCTKIINEITEKSFN